MANDWISPELLAAAADSLVGTPSGKRAIGVSGSFPFDPNAQVPPHVQQFVEALEASRNPQTAVPTKAATPATPRQVPVNQQQALGSATAAPSSQLPYQDNALLGMQALSTLLGQGSTMETLNIDPSMLDWSNVIGWQNPLETISTADKLIQSRNAAKAQDLQIKTQLAQLVDSLSGGAESRKAKVSLEGSKELKAFEETLESSKVSNDLKRAMSQYYRNALNARSGVSSADARQTRREANKVAKDLATTLNKFVFSQGEANKEHATVENLAELAPMVNLYNQVAGPVLGASRGAIPFMFEDNWWGGDIEGQLATAAIPTAAQLYSAGLSGAEVYAILAERGLASGGEVGQGALISAKTKLKQLLGKGAK